MLAHAHAVNRQFDKSHEKFKKRVFCSLKGPKNGTDEFLKIIFLLNNPGKRENLIKKISLA